MFSYSFGAKKLDTILESMGLTAAYQQNLDKAVRYTRALAEQNFLPFARQAADGTDVGPIEKAADHITTSFPHLIVLGTGGSSLGAQAAIALALFKEGRGTTIHTPDSLCPFEMDRLFQMLDPVKTHVLAVSKSGTTAETLAQLLACRAWLDTAVPAEKLADHFTFVTEPGPRALRTYAEKLGSPIIDHPTDVGGRFSVLTCVGMLPVAVAGLSPKAFREGCAELCDALKENPAAQAAVTGAALAHTMAECRDVRQILIMPYMEALRAFTRWHGQLWAESLGKQGKGSTPLRAVGPVDQHSQLQLFLDGPDDKLYTILTVPSFDKGPRIDVTEAKTYGLDYMAGRTIGDMVTCQSRATQEALRARGRIVRELTVTEINEKSLGSLFASFMFETIITAHLMGIDAFDQPAVEEGKILTRQYLSAL